MKTKTWIMIIAAALVVCLGLSMVYLLYPREAIFAEIRSGGKLIATVSLDQNQSFTVESENGTNTVTVKNGRIAVTHADCPDHYCMDRGFCTGGADIVCLPNRLVITFVGNREIDSVVG